MDMRKIGGLFQQAVEKSTGKWKKGGRLRRTSKKSSWWVHHSRFALCAHWVQNGVG
ncbi:hypothetical protein QG37_06246 [Candidozyma auris]|nr:hypothetical protein QG37_06246 [[Candida] auris]